MKGLFSWNKSSTGLSFCMLFVLFLVFLSSLLTILSPKSASAVDAVLPVRGFAHDVEIRSGCTAYTDVAQLDSSECSFWSTNLGWKRFDLKDVNVTSGWYYQFYLNVYVESITEPGTTPLIQTNPVQSINNSFDVVSYNQVASNTYQGGFVNSTAKAGYSYTYSVIVRANETTLNASIRLGSANSVNIFEHLSAGTGEYVTANFQISRLHAFEPIDYSSQLDEIVAAIEQLSQTSDTSAVVSKLNEVKSEQQNTTRAIQAQTAQQHDDYESEVEREEDKQLELEDQSDDLSISAQNPGNPFANLFQTSGCVSMPVFSGWFHRSDVIEVCSPYPQEVRPIIEFVSSVIVVGFLIKIYFKLFKGGYAS